MKEAKMNILVSGASSGLGKYLREFFKADSYDRAQGKAPESSYDMIIHCAFDVRRQVPLEEEAAYTHNTLGITQDLLNIRHKHFVFISSADVYPTSSQPHREDETIEAESLPDRYGKSKLAAEKMALTQANNPLILRPTAMLGPYMRPNSLTKILSGENPKLTLNEKSSFNYVLHEDIAHFISLATLQRLSGIFNIASSDNVTLETVCAAYQKPAQFGDYIYKTGTIDNKKAAAVCPIFSKTSLETVTRFF